MKRAVRFIAILMSVFCMLSLLFSCAPKLPDGKPEETAPESLSPGSPEEPYNIQFLSEPILLCSTEESTYRMVRPNTQDEILKDIAIAVVEYPVLKGFPKLNFSWGDDCNERAEGQKELLIGFTNRPESRKVMEEIGYDDYAIVAKDGQIIVAAHNQKRLQDAVSFLCEHLLQIKVDDAGVAGMYYLGDYRFESEEGELFFGTENPMEDYSIVYNKDSSHSTVAAKSLQEKIAEVYGVQLALIQDSTPERSKEILVGAVNRPLAREIVQPSREEVGLVVVTQNGRLFIGSQNDRMTRIAVQRFCDQMLVAGYSYGFNLPKQTEIRTDAYEYAQTNKLAAGADMRVMSFNILCELYDKAAVIEGREGYVVAPIFYYEPDIVGLQEVSENWYAPLRELFGSRYVIVDEKTDLNITNYSPLAYNTEKLILLEHGVDTLDSRNNNKHRVLSWGYFERKSDGARFVAVNTHWDLSTMPESRTKQAQEMGELVKSLHTKYNCPVITTGDHNTRATEDVFKLYCEKGGLFDAQLNAKEVQRAIRTSHKLFSVEILQGEAIDHICATSEVEFLYYNILTDKAVANSSDHFLIYSDIKLNK